MERLTAFAGLATNLIALSQPGDTIQLRPENGKLEMLNDIKNVDATAAVAAYDPHSDQLTVEGNIPSIWLINGPEPLGELLYSYPEAKLTVSYNVDGERIAINNDRSISVDIESETQRLKVGRFEDSYIELLFGENAEIVQGVLNAHGLKIKKLDVDQKHITVIDLEPRT